MSILDVLTKPKQKHKPTFNDIVSSNFDVAMPPISSIPQSPAAPSEFDPAVVAKQTKFASDAVMQMAASLSSMDVTLAAMAERSNKPDRDKVPSNWKDKVVVDEATAIRLLQEVAAEHPGPAANDMIQSGAFFKPDGVTGNCINGAIFQRLGFQKSDLADHYSNVNGGDTFNASAPVEALNRGGFSRSAAGVYPANMRMTYAAATILSNAMYANDHGHAWRDIAAEAAI